MTTKLTQLRELNGDFARSYKYLFTLKAQAKATLLTDLMSQYENVGAQNPLDDKLSMACVNCVLPNVGAQEITAEVGNHTLRLAGRKDTSGTISPEFILSGDYTLYKFLRKWAGLASSHNDDTQFASYKLLANITITAKNVEDESKKAVILKNVWCRNCPEINFSDDSNDIIRFTPEFAYEFADDDPAVDDA